MNIYLFLSLVVILILASVYLGKKASSSLNTSEDFYLSGRSLGLFSLCLTFLATQLGGGAIIGAADAAYNYGWQAIYYSLGISLGLIILSFGIGKKLREKNISTIVQIFQDIYQDKITYKIASIVYILSTFLILVAIAIATRKYLIAIDYYNIYFFLFFWCGLIFYTSVGGLKAVVQTDILQTIVVLVIFVITFIYLLFYSPEFTSTIEYTTTGTIPWSSWLLMPLCYTIIGQDMGQRCFSGASNRAVSLGTFFAGILLIIASVLPTYIGMLAKHIGVEYMAESSILILAINKLANPTIVTLFSFAVLMAIISTADSLLCAISSNIAIDIFSDTSESDKAIPLARIATLLSGILAFIISLSINNIIQMMVMAYEITIVCFFIPILFAIFTKQPSKYAARVATATGALSYVFLPNGFANIPKEVICILLCLTAYLVTSITVKIYKNSYLKSS